MNLFQPKPIWPAGLILLVVNSSLLAGGARIQGRVMNGTTGQPVARQTLELLMPRGGMQQVATAATDAAGHFAFPPNDLDTTSFYLLQATYQDVNYHAPVKFDAEGAAQAEVTVYDSTRVAPSLRIQSARLIVQAEGGKVHVQDMFAVRNAATPPRSYVNPEGTFRLRLSQTGGQPTAAVAGMMNMPLPQTLSPGPAPGDFFLQYPLKPGLTVVMVAYDMDYAANQVDLKDAVAYPIDRAEMLVSPPGLAVNSRLFQPAGVDSETGGQRYSAENLQPNTVLAAGISGRVESSEPVARQAGGEVKTLPTSMTRLGGPLLVCFLLVLLWGLGVGLAKEWPRLSAQKTASQIQKELAAQAEALFNSLADLDELFAAGKIAEKPYWKERLELKARLVATLKKAPPALLDSYATRHTPR